MAARMKPRRYIKPSFTSLAPEINRRIYDTIMSAPPANVEGLRARSAEVEARIRAAKANGTF